MILVLLLILTLSIAALLRKRYNYWSSRGLVQFNPNPILGNIKLNEAFKTQYLNLYRKFKEKGVKHGGIYFLHLPVYMILDPEVVKCVLVKNFESFRNRGHTVVDARTDPLSVNIINLEDEQWKSMRSIVSQGFTAGKLKKTFERIFKCTHDWIEAFQEHVDTCLPINTGEYSMRYIMDVMGSYIFSIQCNCLKNPDAEFKKYGAKVFEYSSTRTLKMLINKSMPKWLQKHIKLDKIDKDTEEFFLRVVRETVKFREENTGSRNDFIQLLLDQKKNGKFKQYQEQHVGTTKNYDLEETELNLIAAQCFLFFVAGFELSSTTIGFALYELTQNRDILKKLRDEINTVLGKHQNEFNYESVNEMVYLECVMKETLRKYSPVPFMVRRCNRDFKVPGSDLVIEKGINLHVPIVGFNMDPEYYPDPERFDPERFMAEAWEKLPYYPFGDGPRICIASRLGMMQTKLAVATIIKNFDIRVNSKTIEPLRWSAKTLVTTAEGGIWLDVLKTQS